MSFFDVRRRPEEWLREYKKRRFYGWRQPLVIGIRVLEQGEQQTDMKVNWRIFFSEQGKFIGNNEDVLKFLFETNKDRAHIESLEIFLRLERDMGCLCVYWNRAGGRHSQARLRFLEKKRSMIGRKLAFREEFLGRTKISNT
jgi:hypothetical protein